MSMASCSARRLRLAVRQEPIAGVTPFSQMSASPPLIERRDVAEEKNKPARIGWRNRFLLDGRELRT